MSDIITTLHPENDKDTNLFPNIKKENIPNRAIDKNKLSNDIVALLNQIGSLTPSGVDTSTNILAFTSNKGIYVASNNGKWYFWNGTQYTLGGQYLTSLSIPKKSIKLVNLDDDVNDLIFMDDYVFENVTSQYTITNAYVNKSTGAVESNSNAQCSNLIDTSNYNAFYISGASQYATCLIATYDENQHFLRAYCQGGSDLQTYDKYEFIPQEDEKYVRFSSFSITNNPLIIYLKKYTEVKESVEKLIEETNVDIYYNKDITNTFATEYKYINKTNGSVSNDDNSECTTNLIPVDSNQTYYISGGAQYLTCLIATYNSSGVFLRSYGSSSGDYIAFSDYEFTPQADEKYARFGTYMKNTNPLVIKISTKYIINQLVEELYNSFNSYKGVLYGKKLVVCGDSFTAGDELSFDKTYGSLIAIRNNMNLVNMSRNGGYAHYSENNASFTYSSSPIYYRNIPVDADFILLAFGLNELSQTIGTNTSVDNTTIWGAYNEVLSWLITNRPNAKIGIISNDAWMTESFRNTLKEISAYWGVSFLDLKEYGKPLLIGGKYAGDGDAISSDAVTLRNTQYRISNSNSHPNEEGQKARSTIIENWLKTI